MEESLARAASLASRRSFSFRARWTSSSILGSEGKKLAHVLNHVEHTSPSCAVSRGMRMSAFKKNALRQTHISHIRPRTRQAPVHPMMTIRHSQHSIALVHV